LQDHVAPVLARDAPPARRGPAGAVHVEQRRRVGRRVVVRQLLARGHVAQRDPGTLTAERAAMAKYWLSDLQGEVLDACVQLHGGYGFMTEYDVARWWTDARVQRIYGGTNEIMKEIIGRSLGL
jgi:alkylation response protein AidB-like acyl-CoA dehydrogenase